jgi:hypothetical protein
MIQEFAQYIENLTTWRIDIDLFVGHLPGKLPSGGVPPERCVVILENTPGAVIGYLRDRQDKEIQIWNRARSYFTARTDAYTLYEILHGKANLTLPVITSGEDYLIMVLDAVGTPAPIENPGPKGLFVYSTNYILRIEDPNA